jgi:hypothetical protein
MMLLPRKKAVSPDLSQTSNSHPIPIRKLLRRFGGVEMWHVQEGQIPGQKWPAIRYLVSTGDDIRTFDRPHEAWGYFQKLTNAPNKNAPPAPPLA